MQNKQTKKTLIRVFLRLWCGHRDLNPDDTVIRPSNVRVCQFRHDRISCVLTFGAGDRT